MKRSHDTRIYRAVLTLVVFLCSAAHAYAQDYARQEQDYVRHAFDLAPEVFYYSYKEPGIMENEGAFVGLMGSYTYRTPWMYRAEARFDWGQVDYTSTNTGSSNNHDDFIFELRNLFGYYVETTLFSVYPYVGVGYRYLNDDSSGTVTTTGHSGYERESNYLYGPLGLSFDFPLKEDWHIFFVAEYDVFLWGRQKSHLGDAVSGLGEITNDQEEGYGLRFAVSAAKRFPALDFYCETFVRWWEIDDSDVSSITYNGVIVGYGLEPKNETLEIGAKVGMTF